MISFQQLEDAFAPLTQARYTEIMNADRYAMPWLARFPRHPRPTGEGVGGAAQDRVNDRANGRANGRAKDRTRHSIKRWATVALAAGLVLTSAIPGAWAEKIHARLLAQSASHLVMPHDLILSPDGQRLYVADMGQHRVAILNPRTLAFLGAIGGPDVMSFPHDVTFDGEGRLMVADSGNDRILIYAMDEEEPRLVETWDGLDGVEGLVATPEGVVYAALATQNKIVQLNADGTIRQSVGEALGMAFERPHDVDVLFYPFGTTVVATDPGNHRLVVFDPEFRPLFEISTWNPPFSEPKYISVSATGNVFVADQFNNRIRVLSAGSLDQGDIAVGEVRLPEGVCAQAGLVWISDTERGRVALYEVDENH